jgi:hypothetical protein
MNTPPPPVKSHGRVYGRASQQGSSPGELSNVFASRLREQISLNTVSSYGVFHLIEILNV